VIIIGLTGYKGSGKTSAAEVLVEDHGFTEVTFAGPLKRMVRNFNPIVGWEPDGSCSCGECGLQGSDIYLSDLYNWGFDDEDIKMSIYGDVVRGYHERFGTEVMRAEDPNYWIRQAARTIEAEFLQGTKGIVVSDIRFPNEAEFIYAYNRIGHTASVWNVMREEAIPEEGEPRHSSEAYAGRLDEGITIVNDGSFEELAVTVATALDVTMSSSRGSLYDLIDMLATTEGTDGEE